MAKRIIVAAEAGSSFDVDFGAGFVRASPTPSNAPDFLVFEPRETSASGQAQPVALPGSPSGGRVWPKPPIRVSFRTPEAIGSAADQLAFTEQTGPLSLEALHEQLDAMGEDEVRGIRLMPDHGG